MADLLSNPIQDVMAIVGKYQDGKPIWKKVGISGISKGGKPYILLDKTFNPAGAFFKDIESSSIPLYMFEQTPKKEDKPESRMQPHTSVIPEKNQTFNPRNIMDFDYDIPF